MLLDRQSWDNKTRGWHVRYEKHPKIPGVAEIEGNEALALSQDPWKKFSAAKEVPTLFTMYSNIENTGYNKPRGSQDTNLMLASTGSNHSEISRAMEKSQK